VTAVKSNPVPDSGTVAFAPSALDAIVSVPVCAPELIGANATLTVQFAPAASAVPQVLPVNLNPVLAVRTRLSSETDVLVFEIVTVVALLVEPTPVVGKATCAGNIWTAPVSPPVPLRATMVAVAIDVDAIVNVPVSDPLCIGANPTPAVQLAPAARLLGHVFCARLNGPLTDKATPAAAVPPELAIVTVCAALVWPIAVGANVSCAGFALSADADCPAPLSGTTTGTTPGVADVTVSVAAAGPAAIGLNSTCTVQLAPAANDAPHVVVPVEKLVAAWPAI